MQHNINSGDLIEVYYNPTGEYNGKKQFIITKIVNVFPSQFEQKAEYSFTSVEKGIQNVAKKEQATPKTAVDNVPWELDL